MITYNIKPGTTDVSVVIRIIDSADRTIVESRPTLDAGRFKQAGGVDFQYTLPIDQLAPGPHLLTIDAARGRHRVRRDARFEIR